jgi:superfamily II DNA or RNA helicase
MAQYARHTLLLTGTPYRADNKKLVLADYVEGSDGRLRLVSHAEARYRDGIGARPEPYLRRFEMSLTEIHVKLINSDDQTTYENNTSSPDLYRYMESLKPALRRPDVWQSVSDKVVQRLRFMQRINPEYRALVACMEQSEARQVAGYLRRQYPNLRVELATSDDGPIAEKALRKFKAERADVLVTVRMAFLGYDCPKITVVGVLTNYRDPGHLMQLVFRGGRVWDPKLSGQAAKDQRLHIVTTDDPKMRMFLDYLKREEDKGIKEREEGVGGTGGGGLPGDDNPCSVTDAFATTTTVESETGSVEDDDRELLESLLHSIGPITTVSQLAEAAEQLGLFQRQGGLSTPSPSTARAPKTEQEIVKECKSRASGDVGAYLRRLGYEPSDGNYQKKRQQITSEINRAFGINSTEVLTTKERAREYEKHVKQWISER